MLCLHGVQRLKIIATRCSRTRVTCELGPDCNLEPGGFAKICRGAVRPGRVPAPAKGERSDKRYSQIQLMQLQWQSRPVQIVRIATPASLHFVHRRTRNLAQMQTCTTAGTARPLRCGSKAAAETTISTGFSDILFMTPLWGPKRH